jgi:hypothetical protein
MYAEGDDWKAGVLCTANLRVVGAIQLLLCADVERELGPVASTNEVQTLNGSEFRGGRVQALWMPLGSGGAVDP